jgi:hypothetical protein
MLTCYDIGSDNIADISSQMILKAGSAMRRAVPVRRALANISGSPGFQERERVGVEASGASRCGT